MEFNFDLSAFATEVQSHTGIVNPDKLYDVIIIGAGPAGITSAVYCMRKGLSVAIITSDIGGQINWTSSIENYPGYRYVEGLELVNKFKEQVKQFEIDLLEAASVTLIKNGNEKQVITDKGSYYSRSVIVASGKRYRKLGVTGEDELIGRGVAFCATCDAPLFKNKTVAVVGGGNSGAEACLDLIKYADKVLLLQHSEKLSADDVLIEKIYDSNKVDVFTNSDILSINGDSVVESITVAHRLSNERKIYGVSGVFVEIGLVPNTDFVRGIVNLNDNSEIIVDRNCFTSADGIFAAGDVTDIAYKQIVIAAGEGAVAALSAHQYLMNK